MGALGRQRGAALGRADSGWEWDAADGAGRAAAHLAAERGHAPVLEFLARAGARVAARDRAGRSVRDYATLGGHAAAVAALSATGAEL